MKAGEVNLIQTQADYQWTPNLTFKDKWYKKPGKITEKILMRVIVGSLSLILFFNLLTYFSHCLLSYTR